MRLANDIQGKNFMSAICCVTDRIDWLSHTDFLRIIPRANTCKKDSAIVFVETSVEAHEQNWFVLPCSFFIHHGMLLLLLLTWSVGSCMGLKSQARLDWRWLFLVYFPELTVLSQ